MPKKSDANAQKIFVADMVFRFDHLLGLGNDLREAFRRPDANNESSAVGERLRCQIALVKIAVFVKDSGIGSDVANHLGHLASYLADLDKGIQHPVLTAVSRTGRTTDRLDVWMIRTTAVSGLECMISAGNSIEAAARSVSTKFPGLKKLCRPGDQVGLKGSLISWRKKLLAGTVSEEIAQDAFTSNHPLILELLESLNSEQRKAYGQELLTRAVMRANLLT
jgi:hypothetical protein